MLFKKLFTSESALKCIDKQLELNRAIQFTTIFQSVQIVRTALLAIICSFWFFNKNFPN